MPSPAVSGRPPRILFFLYHAGYLRHYAEPLRLLAREGAVVHLAFTLTEKDAGDTVLAERLAAEFPEQITFGPAPVRAYLDGWRRTSTLVRAFTDLSRYMHPRYADAPALRARMAAKIRLHVRFGKSDPFSSLAVTRIVDALATRSDERCSRRALRLLAACEQAIPTSGRIDTFVRGFAPDVVLATPLVEYASNQVDYLKSARALGIPTGACIASWDNLTNKGLLRFTPDRVLVWNETQRRELEELHGIDGARAIVTGAQKFDEWFERTPSRPPAEFKRRVGIDDAPFLLYVCSSLFIAPDEVSFVRRWVGALRADPRFVADKLGIVVRPHPQNLAQWQGVDLADLENVVVWPPGGAQPDSGEARADFFDSLAHAAAVVGVNTSVMIEAAIVGRSVLTLLDPAFDETQEGTLHFHYLLRENGGFLQIARSFDEHLEQLGEVLTSGEGDRERIQGFIGSFVRPHGLDAPAAPLVAAAIAELARAEPAAQPSPGPAGHLLRVALLVPTVVATASTVVGLALHRLAGRTAGRRVPVPPPA